MMDFNKKIDFEVGNLSENISEIFSRDVRIDLKIEYMGRAHGIHGAVNIDKYRQSAIDHDYMEIENLVRRMLHTLLHKARPIHPNHPELEMVARKLLQGGN